MVYQNNSYKEYAIRGPTDYLTGFKRLLKHGIIQWMGGKS